MHRTRDVTSVETTNTSTEWQDKIEAESITWDFQGLLRH